MAEKIVKKKTFWLATSLVMLSLLVWAHNFTIAGDSPATSITVGNDAPTITSVVFCDNNALTLNEWTQAAGGTKIATTTFTVTDSNGCSDISTTTLYLYHSDIANCSTTAQADNTNCYPSTSTPGTVDSAWTPRYGAGNLCDRTSCSGNTATFLCTSTLYFTASSTAVWMAFASTSDLSYAQANRTSNVGSAQATVNALQALEVSNDIAYATLSAGQDSSDSWVTTTATSTGNTAIDIKFHGGSLTKSGDDSVHIPAFKQQFTTTTGLSYDAATTVWLATSTGSFTGEVHDVTMVKATNTTPYPSSADKIMWGIGIPSGQAIGTYSSTTSFVVTSAIVTP